MKTRRPIVRLVTSISLCGVVLASLLSAAWFALMPDLAAGGTFLTIQKFDSSAKSDYIPAPDQPFFFLALGNDSREANQNGLGDSIHVIGINPATLQGTMLNVPRDTEAPGGGKINAFHANGGLPAFVDQINKMMGIQINYAITTDFPRFINMVNTIGGIKITLPYDLTDTENSGADFRPGPTKVNGDQALAISRDRHDFDRQGDRQRTWQSGLVILSALKTIQDHHPSPSATMRYLATLMSGITMQNVTAADLFRLGSLALKINPDDIKNCTIPTGAGSGSNLAVGGDAQPLFADFRDDGVVSACEPVPGGMDTPSPGG
jgi:LCP family protein required for cell wall assembly